MNTANKGEPTTPMNDATAPVKPRNRPGKAQRKTFSGTASEVPTMDKPQTSSKQFSKSRAFASGSTSGPEFKPGSYPVIFPTGAGEATVTQEFTPEISQFAQNVENITHPMLYSDKVAEFHANAGITDQIFRRRMLATSLVALAQQLVFTHVNHAHPMGDFSILNGADLPLPHSVRVVMSQYGETNIDDLGTRLRLSSYRDTVIQVCRTASLISDSTSDAALTRILQRSWLPTRHNDERTKFIIACRFVEAIHALSNGVLNLSVEVVKASLFSLDPGDATAVPAVPADALPNWLVASKIFVANNSGDLDALFHTLDGTPAGFTGVFSGAAGLRRLTFLGLSWPAGDGPHLDWHFDYKSSIGDILDKWSLMRPTMQKFFVMEVAAAFKSSASGSPAQVSSVESIEGVTVIKTMVNLSAAEFSLATCFPPTCYIDPNVMRRVIVTTPIHIGEKRSEWIQRDWK